MAAERRPVIRLLSHSAEATEALGERLGAVLRAGDVVALDGELGAGKTCFVRGLARGLGVEGAVASPTFTLMNAYSGRVPLYHFDAWRTGNEEAYLDDGGDEWLRGGGVAVVEWAERVEERLPLPRLAVRLAHRDVAVRDVEIGAVGEGAALDALARRVAAVGLPDGVEQVGA